MVRKTVWYCEITDGSDFGRVMERRVTASEAEARDWCYHRSEYLKLAMEFPSAIAYEYREIAFGMWEG